jgi:hypothetical protein
MMITIGNHNGEDRKQTKKSKNFKARSSRIVLRMMGHHSRP